jgi:hypothetical protein
MERSNSGDTQLFVVMRRRRWRLSGLAALDEII